MKTKEFKSKTIEERMTLIDKLGIFAIVTTMDVPESEILTTYYVRQMIEQFFDYIKSYGKLTPIRKHSMESVRGHVLMAFITAFLAVLIKNRLNVIDLDYVAISPTLADQEDRRSGILILDDNNKEKELILSQSTLVLGFKPSPEALFKTLQMHCADIWDSEIVPAIATKEVKDFFEAFGLHVPETILRKNGGILPVLKEGIKDRCSRKKVFSRKPILTDEQIRQKRAAIEAQKLKEMAESQGMKVISPDETKNSNVQQSDSEKHQESNAETSKTTEPEKKKAGRPLGSKNKKTIERELELQRLAEQGIQPQKRPRGRPVGSKSNRDANGAKKLGRPIGAKDKVKRKRRSDAKTQDKKEA